MAAQPQVENSVDPKTVLTKAVRNAGSILGLSQAQIGTVIGKNRTSLTDGRGIVPDSKAGELSLLLIRCYRSLHALMGGNVDQIRHFMVTQNRGTGGIPIEQIQTITGLVTVVGYLDAMRGNR